MDVTGVLKRLRSERRQVEDKILALERSARHGGGAFNARARSVTEIDRRAARDDNASQPSQRTLDIS